MKEQNMLSTMIPDHDTINRLQILPGAEQYVFSKKSWGRRVKLFFSSFWYKGFNQVISLRLYNLRPLKL
jgi:hypothetical protein